MIGRLEKISLFWHLLICTTAVYHTMSDKKQEWNIFVYSTFGLSVSGHERKCECVWEQFLLNRWLYYRIDRISYGMYYESVLSDKMRLVSLFLVLFPRDTSSSTQLNLCGCCNRFCTIPISLSRSVRTVFFCSPALFGIRSSLVEMSLY